MGSYPRTVGTTPTLVKDFGKCNVVYIYNNGNETLYWDFRSDITTSSGFPLAASAVLSLTLLDGDPVHETIYMISAGGADDVRVIVA